jgi:gluconate 5-dehydrogenase
MAEMLDVGRLFSLVGKNTIVTGASRGIGFTLANGLAAAGASVVAIARSPHPRSPFLNSVRYLSADVCGAVAELFAEIAAVEGSIDILLNAAGITLPNSSKSHTQFADFEQTLKVNLFGPFACCIAARPHMKPGSSIINITSVNSIVGFPENPGYGAAKGGLRVMTKALAVDYGLSGIRVNALAPGYIHTDMTQRSFADPEQYERRRRHTCLGRGEPPKTWWAPRSSLRRMLPPM